MGNTSSERSGVGHGEKANRRDSRGAKEGERPKILMDSPEDADIFHGEDLKAPLEKEEFLAWRQDLESGDKELLARPTVFRWTGAGKEVYLSGSFDNWANKIPLTRSQNNFVTIVDLPEGEHQYKFYVDGLWTHDPSEPVVTNQLGTINNIIQVKKTDFEVFDALMVDSQKCSDMSDTWIQSLENTSKQISQVLLLDHTIRMPTSPNRMKSSSLHPSSLLTCCRSSSTRTRASPVTLHYFPSPIM
ncbi:5'-AMP-activated protein kinase subunit beta-1a isoform X3 [Silurus meridionalis]|uniref:5'-AMP-activated protein kinase subunit beta-1a isoform X3 n=1 Tax=Silurus meridionalis TaxID=175797 RepID=UPI001EEA2EEC|nr:5'-AMP-activated protein kinase subunit beta-1a isoform X3 [Silurus meridionalis]